MEVEQNKRVAGIDVRKPDWKCGWKPADCATIFQQRGGDRGAGGMAGTPRMNEAVYEPTAGTSWRWDKGCQRKG